MCTVTVFSLKNEGFVLTSNRDESPMREPITPSFYQAKNTTMLYPKDKVSGGTWIGANNNNCVLCLLNGAFEKHKRALPYRQSRGKVVTDLLEDKTDIVEAIENYNFQNIEPFTLVAVDWKKKLSFYELIWDGSKKHFNELPLIPHIWSSSTLYSKQIRAERQQWFREFMSKNELTPESIWNFHKPATTQNKEYGVIMDRGFVKTTSITQVLKKDDSLTMNFCKLKDEDQIIKSLPIAASINE